MLINYQVKLLTNVLHRPNDRVQWGLATDLQLSNIEQETTVPHHCHL